MFADKDYNLLIDCGDAVSRAIFAQGIDCNSINGILFTHLHPDHYTGFASLLVQMKMNKRKEPLSVFVHHSLINTVKNFLQTSYIFMERIGFSINDTGYDFEDELKISGELSFISRKNTHLREYEDYDTTLSYACGSFLFISGNKKIYYSGDIGSADDLLLFSDYEIDLFITEGEHISPEDILSIAGKLNPGKIVVTHLSKEVTVELKTAAESFNNKYVITAEDGLILSV